MSFWVIYIYMNLFLKKFMCAHDHLRSKKLPFA